MFLKVTDFFILLKIMGNIIGTHLRKNFSKIGL